MCPPHWVHVFSVVPSYMPVYSQQVGRARESATSLVPLHTMITADSDKVGTSSVRCRVGGNSLALPGRDTLVRAVS
jgi:hypothetical protein